VIQDTTRLEYEHFMGMQELKAHNEQVSAMRELMPPNKKCCDTQDEMPLRSLSDPQ
jgi:hypothetical protein